MPRSVPKEVIEDSEEEQVTKSSRKSSSKSRGSPMDVDEPENQEENNGGGEDDGEEEEEEYEIEAIKDAKPGVFDGGAVGYLVRWKGYGPEHDSWVTESDAEHVFLLGCFSPRLDTLFCLRNAKELIDAFWKKRGKLPRNLKPHIKPTKGRGRPSKSSDNDVERPSSTQKRKKSAIASTPTRQQRATAKEVEEEKEAEEEVEEEAEEPEIEAVVEPEAEVEEGEEEEEAPKPAKKARMSSSAKISSSKNGVPKTLAQPESAEGEAENLAAEYRPMDTELNGRNSWEKLIKTVDTVEQMDGENKVFFTLNNGERVFAPSAICKKRFPQKLLDFYESNLRWREV